MDGGCAGREKSRTLRAENQFFLQKLTNCAQIWETRNFAELRGGLRESPPHRISLPLTYTLLKMDINMFREDKGGNPEMVRESQRRRFAPVEDVDIVIEKDKAWRAGS